MKKTFTAVFASLLIASLSFAAAEKIQQDTPMSKTGKFTQDGKVAVIEGNVIEALDPKTILIERDSRVVVASLRSELPEVGQHLHGFGTFEGIVKINNREFRHYNLRGVTID